MTDESNTSPAVADLASLLRALPDALEIAANAAFDDLMTLEEFQQRNDRLYPSINQVRRHAANRHENGLLETGAVVEAPGHPLLVQASAWHRWLTVPGLRKKARR